MVGYHLCYGTFPEWPMYEAQRLREYWCGWRTTRSPNSGRTVDWVHMAGPRYLRSEDKRFFRASERSRRGGHACVPGGSCCRSTASRGLRRRHATASPLPRATSAWRCTAGSAASPGADGDADDARAPPRWCGRSATRWRSRPGRFMVRWRRTHRITRRCKTQQRSPAGSRRVHMTPQVLMCTLRRPGGCFATFYMEPPPASHVEIRKFPIVPGGGMTISPAPRRPRARALPPARLDQFVGVRCGSGVGGRRSANAQKPIISACGNGHGCEATYSTPSTSTPVSSRASRTTASSGVSPGSTKPARPTTDSRARRAGGSADSGRRTARAS